MCVPRFEGKGKKEKEGEEKRKMEEARNRFDFSGTSVFGICIRILSAKDLKETGILRKRRK